MKLKITSDKGARKTYLWLLIVTRKFLHLRIRKLEYCFLKHQETRKYSVTVLNKKININKRLDIRDSKQTHSFVV